jgi:hypothetical protein
VPLGDQSQLQVFKTAARPVAANEALRTQGVIVAHSNQALGSWWGDLAFEVCIGRALAALASDWQGLACERREHRTPVPVPRRHTVTASAW